MSIQNFVAIIIFIFLVFPLNAETTVVISDPNIGNGMWGRNFSNQNQARAAVVDVNGCLWTNSYPNEVALRMFDNIGSYMKTYRGVIGTSEIGLWDQATVYNWIPTAIQLKISSSDVDDTLGGAGGTTIEIRGLNANYERTLECISLTGQTVTTTSNYFYRVNYIEVTRAGSSDSNEGDIYIHNSAVSLGIPDDDTKIYGIVQAGKGRSSSTNFSVPAGKSILIKLLHASCGKGKDVIVSLWVKEYGEPWHCVVSDLIYQTTVSIQSEYPIAIGEKADIIVKGNSDSVSTGLSAKISYVIIENE